MDSRVGNFITKCFFDCHEPLSEAWFKEKRFSGIDIKVGDAAVIKVMSNKISIVSVANEIKKAL